MKKAEIKVGGVYIAKVSGKLTTVRVDAIQTVTKQSRNYLGNATYKDSTAYDVTNLRTGRTTTFRSAAKFRSEAKSGDGFKMPGNGRKLKLDDEAPNPYIIDYPAMSGDPPEGPPAAGENEHAPSEPQAEQAGYAVVECFDKDDLYARFPMNEI